MIAIRPVLIAVLLGLTLVLATQFPQVLATDLKPDAEASRQAPAAQLEAPWAEVRFRTDDGMLAYASLGEGPVLVVVPGGPGGSGFSMRHAFRPLAQHHTVVILDNIGRGRSSRLSDPERYTLARDVQDLERLRLHLGLKTMAVYGHSYGGLVAQAYAAQHPQALSHLILGNTLHGARSWQAQIDFFNDWLRRHDPERWQTLMELREQGKLSGSPEAQGLLGEAIKPLYWANRARPTAKSAPSASPNDQLNLQVYLAMLGPDPEWRGGGTLRDVELLPRLKAVAAPTLLLTGRFDPVAPPSVMNEMQRAINPAVLSRAQVFEHSAHRPFTEEPQAWLQTVSQFLAR
ncbi:alpha/beta fold hydrolase [Roseateles sp.]|uniref:alpha/beta fold hydrolase n=1 Tax=Roseateles sp. TaxID=1971397 RepID=UPI003BA7623E